MEAWRTVFRTGIAPLLPTAGLRALREALEGDDPALIQGATTSPPPLACVADWAPEGACPVGYAGWKGVGLATVAAVEEFFGRVCFECDQILGEPAGCRFFVNAWDELPRDKMRLEMLSEVTAELERRKD